MNARARTILARADRRLTQHIARNGIDARALSICAHYERLYAETVAPAPAPVAPTAEDDLTAVLDALGMAS